MRWQDFLFRTKRSSRNHQVFFLKVFGILAFLMLTVCRPSGYAVQTVLTWNPPILNEDGTLLTDLSGYKVYYGTVSKNYTQTIAVGNRTSYTVLDLTEGTTYYFAVTALNSSSNESKFSNEISRTMPLRIQRYPLSVSKSGTGSGTVTSTPAGINCGTDCSESYTGETAVTLSAAAGRGSVFSGWTRECSGTGSCTVTMDAAKSVSASFSLKTYTITVTAGTGGSISPPGTVTVNHGANQTFTITANAGYSIADVLVDGVSAGAIKNYTFSNVTADHTLQVSFALTYPDISVTPVSHDFGDVSVDSGPVIRIFTVVNTGSGNLGVGTNMISDAQTSEFVLWDDNCSGRSVRPADRCTIGVKFLPASTGLKNARLIIVSNDPETPSVAVFMEGNGVAEPYSHSIDLPRTGQMLSYAPNDDGNVQAGVAWPDPRFTDNGDGTVTDALTGLMWLKDGACLGRNTWAGALNVISHFNTATVPYRCDGYTAWHTDWRMPNIRELESLINYGAADSSLWLNLQGFSNIKPVYYWTATGTASDAWSMDVKNAIVSTLRKANTYNVIAVRDAE